MIKLANIVLASPEQMEFIIEGMRNPMNSWDKKDSGYGCEDKLCWKACKFSPEWCGNGQKYVLGESDHSLMQRYWWKEFDTYKVGTVANSCSTMHKIAEKEFTLEDFSTEHLTEFIPGQKLKGWTLEDNDLILLDDNSDHGYSSVDILSIIIKTLNFNRKKNLETKDKKYWWNMIQLLPSSYNQTRNVMLNYEVLANIYRQRKGHKLDEWREFCKWIESLPYSELIIGKEDSDNE